MKKVLGKKGARNIEKRKVNVRIPIEMLNDIDDSISSKKKRSDWICSAIIALREKENFSELVLEEWIEAGNNKLVQFRLTKQADDALLNIQNNIKDNAHDPLSAIIRCAAIQKLISPQKSSDSEP